MKVGICSRKTMEARLKKGTLRHTAVISFYNPAGESHRGGNAVPIDFTGKCDRVMQIPLLDLDPEVLGDFGMTVDSYFPQADELAAFILQVKAEGLDLICQCEYGQSRSAGCAAAILQFFDRNGIEVFADYRYYPNQLVYHKVLDALEKQKRRKNDVSVL